MGRKLCVLIVDDDASFRGLLRTALTPLGLDVLEAPKRVVALGLAADHALDLVIIDGLLPDGDGVHLLEELRGRRVMAPAIFISAFRRDAETCERLTQKLDTRIVLQKPLPPEVIIRHVAQILGIDVGGMRISVQGSAARVNAPAAERAEPTPPAVDVKPALRTTVAPPPRQAPSPTPAVRPRSAVPDRRAPAAPVPVAQPPPPPPQPPAPQSPAPQAPAPQSPPLAAPAPARAHIKTLELRPTVSTQWPARGAPAPTAPRTPPRAEPVSAHKEPPVEVSHRQARPFTPAAPVVAAPVERVPAFTTHREIERAVDRAERPEERALPEIAMPFSLVGGNPGLTDRLREAQAAYKQELAREIGQLSSWVRTMRATGHDGALLDRLLDESHRIRGTSGSFGWMELATALEQLETAASLFRDLPEMSGAWARVELAHDGVLSAAIAGGAVTAPATVSKRAPLVLIIDPDLELLKSLEERARRLGLQVLGCTHVDEALARIGQHLPQALLVGAAAPGPEATGEALSVAKRVRAQPGMESLPVGFMSAEDGLDVRQAAMHAGASVFIAKPPTAEALGVGIERLLGSAAAAVSRALVLTAEVTLAQELELALAELSIGAAAIDDARLLWNAMNTYRPDTLIIEEGTGLWGAAELVRMVRSDPRRVTMPVLVCVANAALAHQRAIYEAGADDVLVSPVEPSTLAHQTRVRLDRVREATKLLECDPLTGLLTRATFAMRFGEMASRCRRLDQPVTLCLLDVDALRALNERRGHGAGDQVLAGFGRLARQRFRAEDLRGRWGGDEFVLAFAGQTVDVMREVVARVQRELAEHTFHDAQGGPFRASMTLGFASVPGDGATVTDALRVADRRLDEARAKGRT